MGPVDEFFNIIFAFGSLAVPLPASCVGPREVLGQEGVVEAGGSSLHHQATSVQAPFIHLNSCSCGDCGAISGLCPWLILNSGTQTELPAWTWFNTVCLDWCSNKFCGWRQPAASCWKCHFMRLLQIFSQLIRLLSFRGQALKPTAKVFWTRGANGDESGSNSAGVCTCGDSRWKDGFSLSGENSWSRRMIMGFYVPAA